MAAINRMLTWMHLKGVDDNASEIEKTSSLPETTLESTRRGSKSKSKKRNSAKFKMRSPSGASPRFSKICIGDKIQISTKTLNNVKGTVLYIGYPFPKRGVRYGIRLSNANGEHDGTFMIDIKTGKVAKQSHIKRYPKRIKKRKYFKARTNHGIFVKKDQITYIDRPSTTARMTIGDKVEVHYRGIGTIRFIGALQHTKEMGTWYGIQLEDRLGRHDGTVNGIQYFECPAQYGLHCRQSHLTLIDADNKENKRPTFHDDTVLKDSKGKPAPQPTGKAKKLLVGFAAAPRGISQLRLPRTPEHQTTESISITFEPQLTNQRLLSVSQQQRRALGHTLQKTQTLSNLIPNDAFTHNISVNILPGMVMKNSKSPSEPSFRKGTTTVVLPGYYQGIKQRRFTDYYDFDEIEDQLGEGEFGIVYKCRPIEIEDDDDFSMTWRTQHSSMHSQHSTMHRQLNSKHSNPSKFLDLTWKSATISEQYPETKYWDPVDDSEHESDPENDTILAVKKIKKAKFHHLEYNDKQKAVHLLQQEIKLLEKIQRLKKKHIDGSEYIIDLMDVFEDRNYLYIVTNYCEGGNLWAYIENETDKSHSEQAIQRIMKQILCGLAFLHENNMAHLDIKPDNIMFNADGMIQLIDFGMSRVIPPLHKAGVLVGTANFVAPEVISGFYDKKADIWSIGVMFFMLRFGYPPFYVGDGVGDGDNTELFELIAEGFSTNVLPGLGAWFPEEFPISGELMDLIGKMLCRDLAERLTAAECLSHPYFKLVVEADKLPLTVMNALTKFSGQCQFNVLISRLFAHQIGTQEMTGLRAVWDKFDIDKDGTLNLEQFKSAMNEYQHGYKEYQIEAMFSALDWNETESINFQSLLDAYSYQRLVAVDERLWDAFAKLDIDNDGHITKAEIKRVLATVNPDGFDHGIKALGQYQPELLAQQPSLQKNKELSIWIGDCMIDVDWDDDGQIDYEEFLRALHPHFNEDPVTPKPLGSPSGKPQKEDDYFFPPSLNSVAALHFIPSGKPVDDKIYIKDNE